jgi:TldD protein
VTGRALRVARALSIAMGLLSFARPGRPAGPEEDVILRALRSELTRSMDLKLGSLEKPYFISYRLTDGVSLEVEASLGALVTEPEPARFRWLKPEVRVGSWELDNSDFVGMRSFAGAPGDRGRAPVVEDDEAALRHDVWLATDEAYKSAIEQFAQKQAALKNRVETDKVADFTAETPAVAVLTAEMPAPDAAAWRQTVRRLSAIFRDFREIQESSVRLRVLVGRKYFVSSEGAAIRWPAGLAVLSARASTQASDGAPQRDFVGFYGRSLGDLPPEKEMATRIRAMAEELARTASAAPVESYSGPVLFDGQAAAELFAQVLVPQLSGQRPPVFEREEMAAMLDRSELAGKLNRPVLPEFLTVVDDPTRKSAGGASLVGAYEYDEEGVRAAPVTLIENGTLKTLVMSRRPSKEIPRSNGHGRAMSQGSATAVIGNLFISAAPEKAVKDPKAELLRMCRAQKLEWCLRVAVLDQPGLSGSAGGPSPMFRPGGRSRESLTAPLVAFKVFAADGREEPVRGLVAGEVTLKTLKDIAAVGADARVHNRQMGGGGVMAAISGFSGADDSASGIPVSIVAPSVLLTELDFKRAPGSSQKPPLLPRPEISGAPPR